MLYTSARLVKSSSTRETSFAANDQATTGDKFIDPGSCCSRNVENRGRNANRREVADINHSKEYNIPQAS